MKEKDNKKLERLVDKMMKETSLDTPSVNFTSRVMSRIEVVASNKITSYRPLIPKPAWIGICASLIVVLAYSFFDSAPESDRLSNIDLGILKNLEIGNKFSNLVLSKKIIYSISLFATMFVVQISLLKVYFNKRTGI